MARIKIAAGNWKMNLDYSSALNLVNSLKNVEPKVGSEMILAPPFIYIGKLIETLKEEPHINVAAQNCYEKNSGAFTGEVAAEMLASIGCKTVILGHSERRAYFNESNDMLAHKVNQALDHELRVIFCCGESLEVRKDGKEVQFVTQQLFDSLFHLTSQQFSNIVIAYEPIWAIGTGETASAQQAQDMHHAIRNFIENKYGEELASNTSILYGGSVKSSNANELFSQADVDGGLVGGASLDPEQFTDIYNALK